MFEKGFLIIICSFCHSSSLFQKINSENKPDCLAKYYSFTYKRVFSFFQQLKIQYVYIAVQECYSKNIFL